MDFSSDSGLGSRSSIGEFFGGTVGTIWTLAGIILFYLALIYQRRELELQRKELVETGQILDRQSQTIELQQFENTFFSFSNFIEKLHGRLKLGKEEMDLKR